MKINFDEVLKNAEGEDDLKLGITADELLRKIAITLTEKGSITKEGLEEFLKEQKPFQLKTVAINALMSTFEDEKNLSGEDKLSRYVLSCKIRSGGECDLTVDEISIIKKLIGKAYGTLIVGQTWPMLEGEKSEV